MYYKRESMNIDEFGIKQPNQNKVLYRYMDKWKYDSLKNNGLVFTNAEGQEDKYDCINHYKDDGYTRRENYVRKYKYLSCWTMDNKITTDKIFEYCSFTDLKNNSCDIAYIVETTCSKLNNYLKMTCGKKLCFRGGYIIKKGIVKYLDLNSIKGKECAGVDDSPFVKDIKYNRENEYRLLLVLGNSFNIYNKEIRTHTPKFNDSDRIKWIKGNPKDFLTNVYQYNKSTNELRQIGIPIVATRTNKYSRFKPSKVF